MILGAFLQRWHSQEKLRFLVIGAFNTLWGYGCFALLYLLLGDRLHYLLVAVLGHFLATSCAYYLQRRIVFRSSAPATPEFLRYNASLLAVLFGGVFGLYFFVSVLGIQPLVAQAIVTLISVAASYLAHRHFTFSR